MCFLNAHQILPDRNIKRKDKGKQKICLLKKPRSNWLKKLLGSNYFTQIIKMFRLRFVSNRQFSNVLLKLWNILIVILKESQASSHAGIQFYSIPRSTDF